MDLTYAEALAALASRGRFGIRLGLGRTRALLRELGSPEAGVRGALIAGTNGKGSVLALCEAALRAAGHRVGATPKPHLVSYRERLQVAGEPVDAATFARLVDELLPIADRVARRHGPPTEFELLTALVFRWFAEAGVDVALVEVGLGGRLDATHAWDGGVAVVTNVDLDHTDRLGATIPAIAREKAAIIERGDLAVTGADGPALDVIRRRARRLQVPLAVVQPSPVVAHDLDGLVVDVGSLGPTRIGLLGRHQAANVAVADATLDALARAGIAAVGPDARRTGYAAARWPGRLELVRVDRRGGTRPVLLDGAHNPAGARALAAALVELGPMLAGAAAIPGAGSDRPAPLTLVVGTMADKDAAGMVTALATSPAVAGCRIVCTRPAGARALDPAELAATWERSDPTARIEVVAEPVAAVERAMAVAEDPVVVAGSLYLVGEIRGRLVDGPLEPDPALPGSQA
ncbi:MAG TPA: Mur ligase family protein [Candidatus Limnocylindrales bacterium]|nr:Mur ligase family protein [Candidatus Limnocylindrales bacterium]